MKKYFFTAAALLIAASCTRELPETPSPVNEGELVSFTIENARGPVLADKDQDGSRTALGNLTGSVVNWTAGDNAILFDNSGSCAGHLFTGSVQSDNTKINLSGEMHEGSTAYWLLYPYNSNASLSSGVITTTLSASQNAVAGSFADKTAISLAKGTRTPGETGASGLTFDNLCAVLAITIPTYVDNAQSVTIASNNGTAMAGSISFNASTGAMTAVSGASSITLNGPLNAGQTYFAVVAPANYTGGFTLTLTTAGNNTYSAATTRDLKAKAGTVYSLGTLGVKLNVTPTLSISHTTNSSNELNGTDASLTISVDPELAAMIDSWALTLKNSNNVVVRNYESTSGTGEVANGYVYLPQGTYTLSGTYTTKDGKTRNLPSVNATSPAPTFTITVDGYTSYDYGVGTDGYGKNVGTANGLDGSTIYDISATLNITSTVLNQLNYTAFSCTLDGSAISSMASNKKFYKSSQASQSWKDHTIAASATFDGKTVNASRKVYVTGIPYTTTGNKMYNVVSQWSFSNNHHSTKDKNYVVLGKGSGACKMYKDFYCPSYKNMTLNVDYKIYGVGATVSTTITFDVGSTQVFQQKTSYMKTFQKIASDGTATFTSSSYRVSVDCSYGAGATGCEIYYINLRYK